MLGLGRELFPVKQAARNGGAVVIVYMNDPKVAASKQVHIPTSRAGIRSLFFCAGSRRDGKNGRRLATQAAATAILWHGPQFQEPRRRD